MNHQTRAACVLMLVCVHLPALAGCAARGQEFCGEPIKARDNTPRQVTVLGDALSPVRTAFNDASDRWRVVALVSPTCSECILGAEAVEQEITARYPGNQVPAIIAWIPMLASDNEQAARQAATIFPPPPEERATQFYDSRQTLGTVYARQTFADFYERARKSVPDDHWLAQALDDRSQVQQPQWDLYMLYAPGTRWAPGSTAPPLPTHWIRHLGRMEDRKTSTYWQDSPESGPREGELFDAMRAMAEQAIGQPQASLTQPSR